MVREHISVRIFTTTLLVGLFGLAVLAGSVALRPAMADGLNGAAIFNIIHLCASSAPCIGYTNTGSGEAIALVSKHNTAVSGESDSSAVAAIYAHNPTLGYGLIADSKGGDAIKSVSGGGRGLDAFGGGSGGVPVIAATALQQGVDLFDGYGAGQRVVELDDQGNLYLTGQLFTSGSCSLGCIKINTTARAAVTGYEAAGVVPTIEDFGTAEIVAGHGFVRIAADFGQAIDSRSEYLVFLTPEGDNRGLYVTGKSAAGFTIRESQNGHATLSVEYRIVAKPYGSHETRLAAWSARSVR